jgi:hypothetical protein
MARLSNWPLVDEEFEPEGVACDEEEYLDTWAMRKVDHQAKGGVG